MNTRKIGSSIMVLGLLAGTFVAFAASTSGRAGAPARAGSVDASALAVRGMPHPGLYGLLAAKAPTAGVQAMPHPGLYRLIAVAGSGASVRGMPHPGLYGLVAAHVPGAGVQAMPHPGLYRLLISQ